MKTITNFYKSILEGNINFPQECPPGMSERKAKFSTENVLYKALNFLFSPYNVTQHSTPL